MEKLEALRFYTPIVFAFGSWYRYDGRHWQRVIPIDWPHWPEP